MLVTKNYQTPITWAQSGILQEVVFKASLSGGKGGQHVNKTSSKAELYWTPALSTFLDEESKQIIIAKLSKQLSTTGELRLVCDESRSQLKNKELLKEKFYKLLATCFKIKKARKPTKVPKAIVKKRLDNKARRKEIKEGRKKL